MARDRLMISDVSVGVPATWHRNTLSIFGSTRGFSKGGWIRSVPSQIVHPDGSFNVGIDVDSVHLDHRVPHDDESDVDNEGRQPLMVYASVEEDKKRDLLRDHSLMLAVWFGYLACLLWFGPMSLRSREATYKTSVVVALCWISVVDLFCLMCVLSRVGFMDAMGLSITMLTVFLFVQLLYTESVPALCLVASHCAAILGTRATLLKCSNCLFMVSKF
ncbi:putative integral membrane protein [Babesia bovis T2Bo]|uniref:Uncharacterized protein n=1 Tax=Babesia bovis TaxID=5865 RepID=A7AWH4_BABBO|nr:putative integral membrane protein [Babesia bovis T2Bo]EDO05402.1 putative integral membrane protein [Babesia bovis T2Bo]|eukprot:XP_001608970.1 hypothetical protein [Babesia bovis T2Bo]